MQTVIIQSHGLNTGKTIELQEKEAEFYIQKAMGYKRLGNHRSYLERFNKEETCDYNEGVEIIYQLVNKKIRPKGYRNATRPS